MAQQFKLPDLGEGIHEGEVTAVLVAAGDRVVEGQPILEVETDKATVQIPSPFTGTVAELRVKANDIVKVGSVLIVFGDTGAEGPFDASKEPWRNGAVGSVPRIERAVATGDSPRRNEGPVPASPSTRRIARELGVDLRQVAPSGPAGLVTAQDVRSFANSGAQAVSNVAAANSGEAQFGGVLVPTEPQKEPGEALVGAVLPPPPLPDFTRWGRVERMPLRSVRRATAGHMALAWSQIPHVSHQDVVDITRLESFRREQGAPVDALGGKLTLTVLVMKAVVVALKSFPRFNSSLDVNAQEIVLKQYYHLGIAVDTDRGLVVPVIRDVDRKSVAELAVEMRQVAERARAGQTALEEMQGGSFTITNIGALGGTGFTPIVNYPQVAILGMGRAQLQPVVLGDEVSYEIVPRLMMPLVLGFDHRVLDGADAARFVRIVKELLENPDHLWLRI